MTTKKELHHLVDELPKAEFEEARRFLEFLRDDPPLRGLREAPVDDEPVTAEDIAAIEEGKAAYRRGDFPPPKRRRVSSWLSKGCALALVLAECAPCDGVFRALQAPRTQY